MKGYVLSRAAVADLDMIWDYTFENWAMSRRIGTSTISAGPAKR